MSAKIKKQLQDLTETLDQEVEKRNNFYAEKSDKWQDSEKGSEYQERTELFQEMYNSVTDWSEQLEEE